MNTKHRRTLAAIFVRPTPRTVRWPDVEALVRALGGVVYEGAGSRVEMVLNAERAVFHRPHPGSQTRPRALRAVEQFLRNAGISP